MNHACYAGAWKGRGGRRTCTRQPWTMPTLSGPALWSDSAMMWCAHPPVHIMCYSWICYGSQHGVCLHSTNSFIQNGHFRCGWLSMPLTCCRPSANMIAIEDLRSSAQAGLPVAPLKGSPLNQASFPSASCRQHLCNVSQTNYCCRWQLGMQMSNKTSDAAITALRCTVKCAHVLSCAG